jgi:hypothetical protein
MRQPLLIALFGLASWLAVAAACTPPTPPPSAPTVAAVATKVSAIQSGDATPSATAQSVATRLAPTLQVVQQTIGPIATSIARSPVHITDVNVMADDTTIVLQNAGSAQVNLLGWSLLLGRNIALTLPDLTLAPGQTRTVHLAAGTNTDSEVFLNTPSVGGVAITFAPGQRAVLVQPDDQVASVFGTG